MAKKKGFIDKMLHGDDVEVKEKEEARSEPLADKPKASSKKYSDHPKFDKFKGEKK